MYNSLRETIAVSSLVVFLLIAAGVFVSISSTSCISPEYPEPSESEYNLQQYLNRAGIQNDAIACQSHHMWPDLYDCLVNTPDGILNYRCRYDTIRESYHCLQHIQE